jgi:tetratricopeptide (TPR) repeat protein
MVARCSVVASLSHVVFGVVVFLIGGAVGLVSEAHAGKFTHDAAVKPEVRLSDRAKPPPQRADAPAPPSADQLLAVEALLGEVHLEQAELLRGLIARTPDASADEKADYYIRLAELEAKAQRFHRLQGTEDDIALGKETDPKRRAQLAASVAQHRAAANAAVVAVIETYRALVDNPGFAGTPHLDTATFYYAYTLDHAGHPDEARTAYERLLRNYPHSRFVVDAHLALADALFDAGRLAEAEPRYRKVLVFPAAAMYRYAQYKLGWVLLAQRRPQDALELFYQVALGTAQAADRQVLHRAAKHDFVRAYADIGRADRALPAFQRVDGKDPYGMLAALADLYLDQGKFDKAIYVYRELMSARPADPSVCAWQHATARAMLAIGTTGDKVREIEALVRLYLALRDHRGLPGALPAGDAADCRAAAEEMSGQLARAYHQEAVKTQNAEYLGYADRLYRAYLGAFPDAADFADTQYFHAELGWAGAELEHSPRLALQKWEDAANAFTRVVETGKLSAKLIQISADAAMQAWMKALAVTPHPDPADPASLAEATDGTPPVPRALPEPQRKLLAAYDVYLSHVRDSNDDERVAVAFLKANLLRRFDHLADAIPLFEDIVAKHPDHETAEYAAQLVLDSDNRLGREAAMLAFARGLAPAFLAAHPAVQVTVARLAHTALRKQAERLEAEARRTGRLELYVQCGERYLGIYNQAIDAPDADELLYNAGVCFELGKALGGAIRMYETLQKLFPSGKLAARALARLGNVYATTAQYREAAEQLESYAGKYAGEPDAYGAISDAVQFRKGLGDDKQAIADTEKLIATFGANRTAEAAGAYFSLTAIYEKQGDLDRLARHLRSYLDRYGRAGGADRRVIAWSKLGDVLWRQACPVATVDGVCARLVRTASPGTHPAPAVPRRCGDDARLELASVPRDGRKVQGATQAFDRAIAEYERAGTLDGDARGALYHYALARFSRAERDYEQYLAMPLPSALDFDTRKPAIAARSHQRFDAWLAGKMGLGARLRATYQALTTLGDAAIAIAAATRIAATSQNAAAQLYRAEIPANVRSGAYAQDASLAYCEALEQVAEPLETAALDYYQACLNTSTKLGWFSAWSRICERELGHLQPERYPSTLELRREPGAVASIIQPEPAQR